MNQGMRIYEPIFGIEGVGSGQTATVKIPVNRRHIMLRVFVAATLAGPVNTIDPNDVLDEITMMVGTRVVRNEKVADLLSWAQLNKLPKGTTKALTLYFANPAQADVIDETVTAWDMIGLAENSFVIKFKFKSGLTNPSVQVVDVYDTSQVIDTTSKSVIRQIVKRSYSSYNLGSVGDITNIPVDLPISAIYLKGLTQAINHVKVTVNDTQVIHDLDTAQNSQFLEDYNLDASAFSYPLLFSIEGQLARRLEGIRNMSIRVTSAAAQSVDCWIEQIAPAYL
jgi:hypothetical protein